MTLEPRAYYNWLRYNALQDPSFQADSWQIEDLRAFSLEELLEKFKKLDINIDKDAFLDFADNYGSPEEMTVELFAKKEKLDQIYLLIFEMWRRFVAEKVGLSLFCDELDHLIYLYDRGDLESDEPLQDALATLLDILDENLDLGADAKELFKSITSYLGHDLEIFLYNYIFDQIESGNDLYAEELIEDFYAFVKINLWFDFLRVKIVSQRDMAEANLILKNLISELKAKPDLDLQFEILKLMIETGDPELFIDLAKNTLSLVETEADFRELVEIVSDYYHRLDLEQKAKSLGELLSSYLTIKKEKPASLDQTLKAFENILIG